MTEQWYILPYEGFGNYSISNLGRVKRNRYEKSTSKGEIRVYPDKILSSNSKTYGYVLHSLRNSITGVSKTFRPHKLVGQMLIPNPENKKQINHINGIKTDNSVENLEWVTPKENTHHAIRIGLRVDTGENSSQSKLTEDKVIKMRELYATNLYYFKEIAAMFDVHAVTARNAILKLSWKHI